jgi:RNA polymerase sigma-70 factor (ECF subfamily)
MSAIRSIPCVFEGAAEVAETTWDSVRRPPRFVELLRSIARSEHALRRVNINELFVARACIAGDPSALAVFEAELVPTMRRAFARLRLPANVVDVLVCELSERLLVGDSDSDPLLARYVGQGPLGAFVHVAALNHGFRVRRAHRREDTTAHGTAA